MNRFFEHSLRCRIVSRNIFTLEIKFAKLILCIWIILCICFPQPPQCFSYILFNQFALQVNFPESVHSNIKPLHSGKSQPTDSFLGIKALGFNVQKITPSDILTMHIVWISPRIPFWIMVIFRHSFFLGRISFFLHIILEGNSIMHDIKCFLDNRILYGGEFFVSRERNALGHRVLIGADHIFFLLVPQVIQFCNPFILGKFINDTVDQILCCLWHIPIDHLAFIIFKGCRQFLQHQYNSFVFICAVIDLLNDFRNLISTGSAKLISMGSHILIGMIQIIFKYLPSKV